jgi:hypothetical protein
MNSSLLLVSRWLLSITALLWTVIGIGLVATLACWWLEPAPFSTPTNTHVVGPTALRVTDQVVIERDVCVFTEGVVAIRNVRWLRRGDGTYTAPPERTVTRDLGCHTVQVAWPIPDELPPGHYWVISDWTIPLNPLRTLTIPGGLVEVDIIL